MKMTSDRGIEMIKGFEGFKLEAYDDGTGVWTIGVGHTRGVKPGQRCTEADAEKWLKEDLAGAERFVDEVAGAVPLRQYQYDALVSFVFNIGGTAFRNSTLRRKVLANPDDPSIRGEFARWIYAGERELDGLVKRRKAEADMYFGEC